MDKMNDYADEGRFVDADLLRVPAAAGRQGLLRSRSVPGSGSLGELTNYKVSVRI